MRFTLLPTPGSTLPRWAPTCSRSPPTKSTDRTSASRTSLTRCSNGSNFPRLAPQTPKGSRRAESGTLDHEGIVGTGAAISYLAGLSGNSEPLRERLEATFERLVSEEELLFGRLLDGLRALPNIRLYEPPADVPRHPTVSFSVAGANARDVSARLSDEHGIFVSHGNFYAATAVATVAPEAEAAGGIVRVGLAIYSTADDVGRLLEALARL